MAVNTSGSVTWGSVQSSAAYPVFLVTFTLNSVNYELMVSLSGSDNSENALSSGAGAASSSSDLVTTVTDMVNALGGSYSDVHLYEINQTVNTLV